MYTLKIDQLWNNHVHVQSAHVIKQVQVLFYLIAFWLIVDFCCFSQVANISRRFRKKNKCNKYYVIYLFWKVFWPAWKVRNESKTDTDVICALQNVTFGPFTEFWVLINWQIEWHTPYTKHWIYITLCIYWMRLHVHTQHTVVGSTSFYRGVLTDNGNFRKDHVSISQ